MQAAIEMTAKERLSDAMKRHGLTISAVFVPFSKSRKPGEDGKVWRSLNWRVTLYRAVTTRGGDADTRAILTTDYSAGEAHCPSYKQGARRTIDYVAALDYEIEHGKKSLVNRGWSVMGTTPIEPDACDVLHSLVSDADVLDCGTFEEWASNLGYDADSRKAEATYRECLAIALKLRNGLGDAVLAELRDAAQDY